MKAIYIVLITTLFLTLSCTQEKKTTKIFLIRHAETIHDGSKNPELSKGGEKRAKKWASVLKSEKVDFIYSTDYKRTQATAKAISESQDNLNVISYSPSNLDIVNLYSKHQGETLVIVGHSNTTPKLVNRLIGKEKYDEIKHRNHSNLYVLTRNSRGETSSTLLHIE